MRDDGRVKRSLFDLGARDALLDAGVDSLRVGDIFEHHLAVDETCFSESHFEQLEDLDLFVGVVIREAEELFGQHVSIF